MTTGARAWVRQPSLLPAMAAIILGSWPTIPIAGKQGGSTNLAYGLRFGPGVANHPVNVAPTDAVRIPQGWPLTGDGTITCVTCHSKLPALNGGSGPNLRDFDEAEGDTAEFCTKCHTERDDRTIASMHWMALRRAHVRPDRDSSAQASGQLDADSRRCMACHDGVSAVEFSNSTPWNRGYTSDQRRNHPVGVAYKRRALDKSDTRLRPASLLPERVRLPAGNVGCVSCHDLYAKESHLLTVPIEGSALCLTCHDMN